VKDDFSFDWNNINLTSEREKESLYYLKFKTSDSDSLMKYVFGDIYYTKAGKLKKEGTIESKERGYYSLVRKVLINRVLSIEELVTTKVW